MSPYYNCPYFFDRNKAGMPQLPPMAPMPEQPVVPVQSMPTFQPAPVLQPIQQVQPLPPMSPCPQLQQMMPMQMMPMQQMPMQQMPMQQMPMQQMPIQPMIAPMNPPTGLPMFDTMGNMGGMGNMGSMGDMSDMGDMGDMGGMGGMGDMGDMGSMPVSQNTSDPPPILSNNPAVLAMTLFKELTGYPNYGNPSGNADILYTGTQGTWNFNLPAFLTVPGQMRAVLVIRACLDDHANVPVNQYSARITVNGVTVHTGNVPLQHGVPVGGRFTNWRELTFNIRNVTRNIRVRIENTSRAGANDWIAFDWMEIRFMTR